MRSRAIYPLCDVGGARLYEDREYGEVPRGRAFAYGYGSYSGGYGYPSYGYAPYAYAPAYSGGHGPRRYYARRCYRY
jgi:hypothetical protein